MKKSIIKLFSATMAFLLAFSMTLNLSAVGISAGPDTNTDYHTKMSNELMEKIASLNKDDKVEIALWLEDIDQALLHDNVASKTGDSKKSIAKASKNINAQYYIKRMNDISEIETLSSTIDSEKDISAWEAYTKGMRDELNTRVDNYITVERELARQAYYDKNDDILNEIGIEKDNIIFVSQYAPFAIVTISVSELEDIEKNKSIKRIDLIENQELYTDAWGGNLSSPSNLSAHKASVGISGSYENLLNNTYNGTGVKIGQIEPSYPNVSDTYLSNASVTGYTNIYYTGSTTDIPHATAVARILVGSEGLAKGASLYSMPIGNTESFCYAVEGLISLGVNVINMSAGYSRTGQYDVYEKWIDHIANSHSVTFVKSAGNITDSDSSTIVNSPGLAYNVITVGAINDQNTSSISDDVFDSGTKTTNYGNDGCAKPDLLAPGRTFFGTWGTSFSTPMITGIVASMMNIDPGLKTDPMAVKAILTAACDRKVSNDDISTLTATQGAGVVNYGNAAWMIINGRYLSSATPTVQHVVYISSNSSTRNRIALSWLKKNYVTSTTHSTAPINYAVEAQHSNFGLAAYNNVDNTLVAYQNFPNTSVEFINEYMGSITGNFKVTVVTPSTYNGTSYSIAWF